MLKYQKKNQKCFKSLIQTAANGLDMFGQAPQFQILKQSQFSSTLGLVFTIAISGLCLWYFSATLEDILSNNSPAVTFSEIQSLESPNYPLLMNNFTMAILLSNLNLVSLSTYNTYFTITVQNCLRTRRIDEATGNSNVTQKCTKYDLETCSLDKHFPAEFQKEYFKSYNLSNIKCMNAEQWQQNPPSLQGTPSGDDYGYMTILVDACKNNTKADCAPQDKIDAQLATGYFGIHLTDALVKSEKPGEPFDMTISLQYTTFSKTASKQIQQQLKNVEFQTDEGLVFEDIKQHNQFIQSINKETQDTYNGKYMIYETLALDSRSSVYSRSYQKIQTLLGNVGGLWQILFLMSSVLLSPIVQMMMNLQLINKTFDFDKQEYTKSFVNNNTPRRGSVRRSSTRVGFNKINRIGFEETIQPQSDLAQSQKVQNIDDETQIAKFLRLKKCSLYYDCREVLLIIIGCKKQEQRQINYATDKIMNKLDVLYIVQKLMEVDKLKSVLLSREQQSLFNYLPRPTIPKSLFENSDVHNVRMLEGIPQYKFMLEEEKLPVTKLQDAYEAYTYIKSEKQTEIDVRLLETLDEDILTLFQSIDPGKQSTTLAPQFGICFGQDTSLHPISRYEEEIQENQDNLIPPLPNLPSRIL